MKKNWVQWLVVGPASLLAIVTACTDLAKAQIASSAKHEDAPPPASRSLIPPGSDPLLLLQSPSAEQRSNASIFLLRNKEDQADKIQVIAEKFLLQSPQKRLGDPSRPMNQLNDPGTHGAKDAIALLGEFRDTRSVPFLIQHLTLHVLEVRLQPLGSAYPCAGSLISIGHPSLDPLAVEVTKTDDPQIRHLAAYVFVKTLGKNVGAYFIEDRRSKLKDVAARSRLEQLAHEVRTEKFSY